MAKWGGVRKLILIDPDLLSTVERFVSPALGSETSSKCTGKSGQISDGQAWKDG